MENLKLYVYSITYVIKDMVEFKYRYSEYLLVKFLTHK